MSADLEERLGAWPAGPVPPPEPTDGLRARIARRRRRRRTLGGVAVVVVALLGAAALSSAGRADDEGSVRTIDRPTGSIQVPDVVGLTVAEARDRIVDAGLPFRVEGRDGADWFATVIASEPGAGSLVAQGGTVGVRTALPVPPASAVCPGFPTEDLPGGVDSADARPNVEGVQLGLVRRTVDSSAGWLDHLAKGVYVARGTIRPWDRVEGQVVVAQDRGYQVVIELPPGAPCPTWPEGSSVQGAVVTYVRGWPVGDDGLGLGADRVWPGITGGSSALGTGQGFAASMLRSVRNLVDSSGAGDQSATLTITTPSATIRALAVRNEEGWVLDSVGEEGIGFGAEQVTFPKPGPGVASAELHVGYTDRTESRSMDRAALDAGVAAVSRGPSSALLVLYDDRGRVVGAWGRHRDVTAG